MRRVFSLSALVLFSAIVATPARGGTAPQPVDLGRVEGLQDIVLRDGALRIFADSGSYGVVLLPDGKPALTPLPPGPRELVPAGLIPHASVISGSNDIRAAWFAGPTGRYAHGVLGDALEASALKVETAAGDILSYGLPGRSVFEDLTPRLADIDGDGADEIIVVRSYLGAGAAVALFGLDAGKLALLAESQPIGLPNRWLNPVGAGDFDGDGKKEIAVVQTPHIGGILILYRRQGEKLVEFARRAGYSTHNIGSTVLGMSAILDVDSDGADEILLPDQDRRELFAVGYEGGVFQIVWSIHSSEPIVTSVIVLDINGNGAADVIYGLADGSIRMLPR